MLLNVLKEHWKNEEQQATITRLEKQVEALTAGLLKVSVQLELSKAAPQTVKNTGKSLPTDLAKPVGAWARFQL